MAKDLTVYNRTIPSVVLSGLVDKIKSKKELSNLDPTICVEKIEKFLMGNTKELDRLSSASDFKSIAKSKEVHNIVKDVRKNVRGMYGLFQTEDTGKAKELVESLSNIDDKKTHDAILELHVSTQERLKSYPEFYKQIFAITGVPASIFELGAGFNPFSLNYMVKEGVSVSSLEYIATEINPLDAELLKKYFEKIGIHGDAYRLELDKDETYIKEVHADMCIALKLFDLVSASIVEKWIVGMDVKWIVASFPTKTVTKLDMRFKRRAGFQKMLRRLGLKYKTIEFDNELVYVIDKRG